MGVKDSNPIDKIAFINNMIADAKKNDDNFDPNEISNGVFTFGEIIRYLAEKGLTGEFVEFCEEENDKFFKAIAKKIENPFDEDIKNITE